MTEERMVYVAADPEQPGAAWAICCDDPKYAKETAKVIADYIKRGANVMRVTHEVGCDMIAKWVRPEKKTKAMGDEDWHTISMPSRTSLNAARAALAAQPKAEPVDAPNEWTIVCPDGQRFTGASPLKAASAATRHRIQVDPVAAKHFHDAIASLQRENEAENERLLAEHGTLNCPSCGGSGHIGDVAALAAQPDGRAS